MNYKLLTAPTLQELSRLLDDFQITNYVLHEYAGRDVRPNLLSPAANVFCLELWYEPPETAIQAP